MRRREARLGRRSAGGVVLSLVVSCALPAVALAAAAVSLSSGGQLSVTVQSAENHGMEIEPFRERVPPGRVGFRVRQDTSGRPAFSSMDGDCFVNTIANDVVCNGPRSSIRVTGNAGADSVTVIEKIATPPLNSFDQSCVEIPPEPFSVVVNLGGGADTFSVRTLCSATFFAESFSYRVEVNGGAGSDTITGGDRNDTLRGGDLRDELNGSRGDDLLQGDGGSDVLEGGVGNDTVTYAERASAVTARIGGESFGVGGEADVIRASVENVIGGSGGDRLFGTAEANRLIGNGGFDEISGFAGADELVGGAGGDQINGGEDVDSISGGAGADTIDIRDGLLDPISCGDGVDSVIGDLLDFHRGGRLTFLRNRNGLDCENLQTFAVDDGPPSRAVGSSLRIAGGRATVRVACPRQARIACRGRLTVRLGSPRGRVIARGRYSAQLGRHAVVALAVGSRRRGSRVFVETTEPGVSKKGARTAVRLLVVG